MKIEVDIVTKSTHGCLFKDATPDTHPHFYTCKTKVRGSEIYVYVLSANDYAIGKIELNVEKLSAVSAFSYYRDVGVSVPVPAKPSILNGLAKRDHFQGTSGSSTIGNIDKLVLPKGVCDPPPPLPGKPVARKWTVRGFVDLTPAEIVAQRQARP